MNDDVINDLKQFISATVSQNMANVATKQDIRQLDAKLTAKIDSVDMKLTAKIDNIQSAIDESVIGYVGTVDDQVQNHEKRLKKLEHQPAH